jgi:hypothetical protein
MQWQCDYFSSSKDKNSFIKEFVSYPDVLFANNASVKKYPPELESMYFKIHSLPHDFFLIKEGEKILLRTMICQSSHDGVVYFGLLDFDFKHSDASKILKMFKEEVSKWARAHQAKTIHGPINFSTWLPYRLSSFNDGGERFSFEPDRPLEYYTLLKQAGLETNQVFSSKGYDQLENIIQLSKGEYERAVAGGYTFEFLKKDLTEDDMKDLHRLSVSIFAENYLATPIDFLTFKTLYAAQAKKEDYSDSFFIRSASGERIGFFINFVEHDYLVVKTIGIDRGHRGSGISNGSLYLSLTKVAERGIHRMVAAMVKEGAQSESYGRKMHLLWTHLYEILTLPL